VWNPGSYGVPLVSSVHWHFSERRDTTRITSVLWSWPNFTWFSTHVTDVIPCYSVFIKFTLLRLTHSQKWLLFNLFFILQNLCHFHKEKMLLFWVIYKTCTRLWWSMSVIKTSDAHLPHTLSPAFCYCHIHKAFTCRCYAEKKYLEWVWMVYWWNNHVEMTWLACDSLA